MTPKPNSRKPVTDLSQKVVSLAREIDRLAPGEYFIILLKPHSKAEAWEAQLSKIDRQKTMDLKKDWS